MRMKPGQLLVCIACVLVFASAGPAYNPSPGLWTGWLVCDAWGSMYLYNHCHIYPVNEQIVAKLKHHCGKPCVLDVKKTFSLADPGPVRIEEARYARPAGFGELKALSLTAILEAPKGGRENPRVTLSVTNETSEKARFVAAQLAVIVLVKGRRPSVLAIGNASSYPHNSYHGRFLRSADLASQSGRVRMRNMTWYDTLEPGETYSCTVKLALKPGEYYLWGGYGAANFFGPMSLISNGLRLTVPPGGARHKEPEHVVKKRPWDRPEQIVRTRYTESFKSHYGRILRDEYVFPDHLKKAEIEEIASPRGLYRARMQTTDASVVPYDKAKAGIVFERYDGRRLYVLVEDFRTIKLRWINDRLVLLSCNIGHIAGVDQVLDVEAGKWIYQQGEQYFFTQP
ncbi:MAG: hypothetical protein JSU94_08390 [Phycisphaerales bacterium]|nr:MAG: hypothetical protein JSU94_08390 [Phycisphaerales bacterium]